MPTGERLTPLYYREWKVSFIQEDYPYQVRTPYKELVADNEIKEVRFKDRVFSTEFPEKNYVVYFFKTLYDKKLFIDKFFLYRENLKCSVIGKVTNYLYR